MANTYIRLYEYYITPGNYSSPQLLIKPSTFDPKDEHLWIQVAAFLRPTKYFTVISMGEQ